MHLSPFRQLNIYWLCLLFSFSVLLSETGKEKDGGIVKVVEDVSVLETVPSDEHFASFLVATIVLFFHDCIRWLPAFSDALAFALCRISSLEAGSFVLLFSFDVFESIESRLFEFGADSTWLPPSSRERLRGLSVRCRPASISARVVARLLFGVPMPPMEPGGLPLGSAFGLFSTDFDALNFDRVLTPLVLGVAGLEAIAWSLTLPFSGIECFCCDLFFIAGLLLCVSATFLFSLEPPLLGSVRCPLWPFFVSLIDVASSA